MKPERLVTSLSNEEIKKYLFKIIYGRLKKLRRTNKSERFRQYRESWDKYCSSVLNSDFLTQKLISEIMTVEDYNDNEFKLLFGKKRVYNPKSPKEMLERRESWKRTKNSRELQRDYWESRRK